MNDMNHLDIIGRLTKDAELKYTSSGLAICNFSIAVNRSKKQGDGYVDEASFFDVSLLGKLAESMKQHLTKGKQVAITGYLKQERWTKDGESRSKVTIGVDEIQLIGGKPSNSGNQDNGYGNGDNYGNGYGNGYGYGN